MTTTKRHLAFSAMVGGGSALVGWTLSEVLAARGGWGGGRFDTAITCGLVGAAIGVGSNLVNGRNNPRLRHLARRVVAGLVLGGFSGAIGGCLGSAIAAMPGGRLLGWLILGLGVGAVEALPARSWRDLRVGLAGGAVGGLVGGLLFGLIAWGVVGRCLGFVVLGACVETFAAAARRFASPACLTVVAGLQTGREVLLLGTPALLGTSDRATLALSGDPARPVDSEHARVVRLDDGRYALEDNRSRHGTNLNRKRVLGRTVLADGDLIEIAGTTIRFHQNGQTPTRPAAPTVPSPVANKPAVPPPTPTKPTPAHSGMSNCPRCGRPAPGSRPYCIVCNLSF